MASAEHVEAERYRPRSYRRGLGAIAVAASVLGGCGLQTGPEQAVRVTTNVELPPDPSVAELIADGEVTVSELDKAVHGFIECLEDAGMVGQYVYDAERLGPGVRMRYTMPGEGREGRLSDTVHKRCYARFVSPTEGLYDDPIPRTERVTQRRRDTIDCMTEVDPTFATIPPDASVEPGSDMQLRAVQAGNDDIAECIDTAGLGWTEFGTE